MGHLFSEKQNTGILTPNSRIVGDTIGSEYPTYFTLALTFFVNSMVDSVLAGAFFTSAHIAAIGVATAVGTLATGVMILFSHGTYVGYTVALGRGQRRKTGEILATGIVYVLAAAAVLMTAVFVWTEPIVRIFGATDAEVCRLAVRYLRFNILYYPMFIFLRLFTLILGVNGYTEKTLTANVLNFVSNIAFTVLLIRIAPSWGIGAMGFGSVCAGVVTLTYCIVNLYRKRLIPPTHLRRAAFRWQRLKDVLISGLTTSLNMIFDGVAAGFINTMVTTVIGTDGLAIYTVVHSFWLLSMIAPEAMDYVSSPLLTIFYACRDKGGTIRTFDNAMLRGLAYTLIWTLTLLAIMPVVLGAYLHGVTLENATHLAETGIFITLAFAPIGFACGLLITFYDATDSNIRSLVMAVVPDSLLCPLLMAILLPRMGYTGMWLALGGNTLVYMLLACGIHIIKMRSLRIPADRLLHLDEGLCTEYPAIDVTIGYEDANISVLSEKIQDFLRDEKASSRISYITALCMDELATDIVRHSRSSAERHGERLMDVKMISVEETFNIIIINDAERYNPLDFEFDSEDFAKVGVMMAQRYARRIDYNYVYDMNMITIQIAK